MSEQREREWRKKAGDRSRKKEGCREMDRKNGQTERRTEERNEGSRRRHEGRGRN